MLCDLKKNMLGAQHFTKRRILPRAHVLVYVIMHHMCINLTLINRNKVYILRLKLKQNQIILFMSKKLPNVALLVKCNKNIDIQKPGLNLEKLREIE